MIDVTQISKVTKSRLNICTALDVETYTRDLKAKFDKNPIRLSCF